MTRGMGKLTMIAAALLVAANVAAEPTKETFNLRGVALGMPREQAMRDARLALFPIHSSKEEKTYAWFAKGSFDLGCGAILSQRGPGECINLHFTYSTPRL